MQKHVNFVDLVRSFRTRSLFQRVSLFSREFVFKKQLRYSREQVSQNLEMIQFNALLTPAEQRRARRGRRAQRRHDDGEAVEEPVEPARLGDNRDGHAVACARAENLGDL